MANIISRGFGALQRIITRGFFSSSPPSPDCFIGFNGKIEEDSNLSGFIGVLDDKNGFAGALDSQAAGLNGIMTDRNGFKGDLCDVCDC